VLLQWLRARSTGKVGSPTSLAGVVEMSSKKAKGTVRWFYTAKGTGFITLDHSTKYIFFKSGSDHDLNIGDFVEFEVCADWHKCPRAFDITAPTLTTFDIMAPSLTNDSHPDGWWCAEQKVGDKQKKIKMRSWWRKVYQMLLKSRFYHVFHDSNVIKIMFLLRLESLLWYCCLLTKVDDSSSIYHALILFLPKGDVELMYMNVVCFNFDRS
jgi:cold shock CspA family protein